MASSSQSAAAAHSSSVGAARGSSTGATICRDLPAGRMRIGASTASDLGEARPSADTNAGISPLVDVGGAAAASIGKALVDEGTLLLGAIEASYEGEMAPLPSSKGEPLFVVHAFSFKLMHSYGYVGLMARRDDSP